MKKIFIFFLFTFLIVIINADNYNLGYEYYLNGLKYYRSGDYELAQTFLERALEVSPRLENEIPEIKMYLGLSAFQNRDYTTAEIYLRLFEGNAVVDQTLSVLEELKKNNEGEDYRLTNTISAITEDSSKTIEEKLSEFSHPPFFIIMLIIFSVSFVSALLTFIWIQKHGFSSKKKTQYNQIYFQSISDIKNEKDEEINYKTIDEFDETSIKSIWREAKALKNLLNISQEYTEAEENLNVATPKTKELDEIELLQKTLNEEINEILKSADLNQIEEILDELENNNDEITQNISNNSIHENSNEYQNEYVYLKDVIKPNDNTKLKYSSILEKEEKKINLNLDKSQNVRDLTVELSKKNVKPQKSDIERFFNSLFYETNEENIK